MFSAFLGIIVSSLHLPSSSHALPVGTFKSLSLAFFLLSLCLLPQILLRLTSVVNSICIGCHPMGLTTYKIALPIFPDGTVRHMSKFSIFPSKTLLLPNGQVSGTSHLPISEVKTPDI